MHCIYALSEFMQLLGIKTMTLQTFWATTALTSNIILYIIHTDSSIIFFVLYT